MIGLQRAAMVFLPLLAAVAAWGWVVDGRRRRGAVVGSAWNAAMILLLQPFAEDFGWWTWGAHGGLALGLPLEVGLGWALAWGFLPPLLLPERPTWTGWAAVLAGAAWLDALVLPHLKPLLVLGPHAVTGDAVHLLCVFLPGLWLARNTGSGRWVGWRAAALTLAFQGTLSITLPRLVVGSVPPLPQLALAPALLFVAAVAAFAEDGGGTPIPLDPPVRLTTTGPYAYVANPMQLATVLQLVALAAVTGSLWFLGGAVVTVAYAEGFARWHERETLPAQLPGYAAWRASVSAWWPRWRPAPGPPATVWYLSSCDPCSTTVRWLQALGPAGVVFRPAEEHPRPRERLWWERPGCPEEVGVAALARVLEQVNLGFAVPGWFVRLPVVCRVAQLVIDASGGGPRPVTPAGVR